MTILNVMKAGIVLLIYLLNYYLWGILFAHICKKKEEHLFMIVPSGFFIYGFVFFIVIFPLKLIGTSLAVAMYTWIVFWLVSTVVIIYICRKDLIMRVSKLCKEYDKTYLIWIAVTGVQLIYECIYGRYTNGGGAIYYNSYVETEIFTNTLDYYDGVTGLKLSAHMMMYFLQTYLEHSAIVCKLTGLPALIESRQVMSVTVILITSMMVFELGRTIFKNNKYTIYFWLMYEAAIGIMAQCVYIPAYHLYYRSFEGKAIFGMIVIPFMLTLFWRLYDNARDVYAIAVLVVGLFGSLTYCMATMYVIPFLLVGYFPICIIQKSWRQFLNWVLCWLPCIIAFAYFWGAMHGIIDLTIRG